MDTGKDQEQPISVPRLADADALDAICAVLNAADCGAEAFQVIARIVQDTARPYVDDLPVVYSFDVTTPCGLPGARVEVDGEDTIVLQVNRDGAVRIEVTTNDARPMIVAVNGRAAAGIEGRAADQPSG